MNSLRLSRFIGRKRSATLLGHLTDVPFFVNENIGQKILSKDLENIVKKVASGKNLTSTANLGKQIFKRASANSYNPRCRTNSGEIAGGTRRDLQGNLYRRRLDKGTCGY